MTLSEVLRLLQVKKLPGQEDDLAFILKATSELVEENGEEWVKQNRHRLLEESRYLKNF